MITKLELNLVHGFGICAMLVLCGFALLMIAETYIAGSFIWCALFGVCFVYPLCGAYAINKMRISRVAKLREIENKRLDI